MFIKAIFQILMVVILVPFYAVAQNSPALKVDTDSLYALKYFKAHQIKYDYHNCFFPSRPVNGNNKMAGKFCRLLPRLPTIQTIP